MENLKKPLIGTTYSYPHLKELELSVDESLQTLLDFGFDIVRLGTYWNDIQVNEDDFNLSEIHSILEKFENAGQKTVVTVGMKAPRWPEFYIPSWLRGDRQILSSMETVPYVQKVIGELKRYMCIKFWQVENEPLDPSGPDNLQVPLATLTDEIQTVKALDNRPVVVNLWGNDLARRNLLSDIAEIADIIGVDIYYNVPLVGPLYQGPNNKDEKITEMIRQTQKPFWITELQAEPWETNTDKKFADNPTSFNLELLQENFEHAINMRPNVILLWGYEYWYWKAIHGDTWYLEKVREILGRK